MRGCAGGGKRVRGKTAGLSGNSLPAAGWGCERRPLGTLMPQLAGADSRLTLPRVYSFLAGAVSLPRCHRWSGDRGKQAKSNEKPWGSDPGGTSPLCVPLPKQTPPVLARRDARDCAPPEAGSGWEQLGTLLPLSVSPQDEEDAAGRRHPPRNAPSLKPLSRLPRRRYNEAAPGSANPGLANPGRSGGRRRRGGQGGGGDGAVGQVLNAGAAPLQLGASLSGGKQRATAEMPTANGRRGGAELRLPWGAAALPRLWRPQQAVLAADPGLAAATATSLRRGRPAQRPPLRPGPRAARGAAPPAASSRPRDLTTGPHRGAHGGPSGDLLCRPVALSV